MIKYIKIINKERMELPNRLRLATDLLGVSAVAIGYFIITYVYRQCFWEEACNVLQDNELLFWLIFPFVLIVGISIGQFIVLGVFASILLMLSKINAKEAWRYVILYRMPKSWIRKNAK